MSSLQVNTGEQLFKLGPDFPTTDLMYKLQSVIAKKPYIRALNQKINATWEYARNNIKDLNSHVTENSNHILESFEKFSLLRTTIKQNTENILWLDGKIKGVESDVQKRSDEGANDLASTRKTFMELVEEDSTNIGC